MSLTNDKAANAASPEQVDASCRWPLLTLFTGAAGWLFLSTLLGFLGTMKFHVPGMFSNIAFFSYGRLMAAHNALFLYGFGVPAAIGVALWLTARLGRTRLAAPAVVTVAAHAWHLGVLAMWVVLMAGGLTGYEWFEVPKQVAGWLFGAYVFLTIPLVLTLAGRAEKELYPTQWFVLAAVFWFAWIFATASLLIHCFPPRGVAQAAVHWWYGHNLVWVFFGSIALGAFYYFLPKLSGRPLYSRELALFSFWSLLILGTFGGVPHGAPLPAWLPALGGASSVLLLVPVGAAALNCHLTMRSDRSQLKGNVPLSYLVFGSMLLVAAAVLSAAANTRPGVEIVQFTLFTAALNKLIFHGFVAVTLFGAITWIVPRVTGAEWPKPGLVRAQFVLVLAGLFLCFAPLAIGGLIQGLRFWHVEQHEFLTIIELGLNYIRMATMGEVLLLVGHLFLILQLKLLCWQQCRAGCAGVLGRVLARNEASEVTA
jgi:cytochrome c oxidase cbb3-type subunit I